MSRDLRWPPQLPSLGDFPREPWEDRARCLDADPEVFFLAVGEQPEDAKRICEACEVKRECLDLIMRIEGGTDTYRTGIWGGTTPRERRAMARRQRHEDAIRETERWAS